MSWDDFVRGEAEAAAENARDRREQSRPNGVDREPRHSMPPIDQADVARWKGRDPPDIVFTIEDLVPQGMVTVVTSQGGAGKTLLLQTAGTIRLKVDAQIAYPERSSARARRRA